MFLALAGLARAICLVSVRGSANLRPESNKEVSMAPAANKGIIEKASNHSVEQAVEKLKNILQAKGVTLFAVIDHSGEAEKVGMRMPPTKLLIFGSPKAGTPLMLAARPALPSTFRSRFWSGKMPRAKSGSVTTARPICRSGTTCRRSYCKILQSSKRWR